MKYTVELQSENNHYVIVMNVNQDNTRHLAIQKTTVVKNRSTSERVELDAEVIEVLRKLMEAV